MTSPLAINPALITDTGRVRSENEDSVAYISSFQGADSIAIVADGMGGHAAGNVASALATAVIRQSFFASDAPIPQRLRRSLEAANMAILAHAQDRPECAGMGTTCTAMAFCEDKAFLAHIGDSRAYLSRGGMLTQLSEDHSLNAKLIRDGVLTEAEAAASDTGNIILQALGTRTTIEPLIWREGLPLLDGDVLLLCSDGLTTMVADDAIARILSENDPSAACRALLALALEAGGLDNISVGVFGATACDHATQVSTRTTRRMPLPTVDTHGVVE